MTPLAVLEEPDAALATFRNLMFRREGPDPFPLYTRLRGSAPLRSSLPHVLGGVVLSRYQDCSAALRDRDLVPFSGEHLDRFQPGWQEHTAPQLLYRSMVFQHHRRHTEVRRLLTPHFTRSRTDDLHENTRTKAEELLERLAERTPQGQVVDLVEELTLPFPLAVISALFGLESAPANSWGRLGRTLSCFVEPVQTPGLRKRVDRAAEKLAGFFREVVRLRRARPGDDLVSMLVKAADTGDLDESELLGNLLFLFTAGYDSSTSFLGTAVRTLLAHPDQAAAVRQRPELASSAVEELLRYDPPVHATSRIATAPLRAGEVDVPAGSLVWILLASANRDPFLTGNPELLDVTRKPTQHVAFSAGPHACLGNRLARMEAEVLIPMLLRRFPRMRLAGTVRHRYPGTLLRGIEQLPVVLDG